MGLLVFLVGRELLRISWSDVGDALTQLAPWEMVVLLAVVALRQLLAATPLALYVPGLGLRRALINDLSANLVATAAPAPSDIVLRMAMFKAWAIDQARGLTGLVLQSLSFYVARLLAPVIGFGLLVYSVGDPDPVYGTAALTSGLIAVALVTAVAVAARSPQSAAWLGRAGATVVKRVRPSTAGLNDWPAKVVEFQRGGSEILRRRSGLVALDYLLLLVVESLLLVLSLRFVGVTPSDASTVLIIAAFLCAYPLSGLPLLGLGVLDTAVIALIASGSGTDPDPLVAGLVVWRVGFQLIPLVLGSATLVAFRRTLQDATDVTHAADPDGNRA